MTSSVKTRKPPKRTTDNTVSMRTNTAKQTTTSQIKPRTSKQVPSKRNTLITVRCDVGFGNTLYIRGKGGELSWEKGLPLKNTGNAEWTWEPTDHIKGGEFKVLVNDTLYEKGRNHSISSGNQVDYSPTFPSDSH